MEEFLVKMVKEETKNGKTYFMCEACNMYYENRELAEKCEDFCNKHNACSTEIAKHSVQIWNGKKMINKLIFLYHGTTRTVPGSVPSTGSSTPGLIAVGLLILLGVALWMYFTRKKGIMEWGEKYE